MEDVGIKVFIIGGRVYCFSFFIVIMISNGEWDFFLVFVCCCF